MTETIDAQATEAEKQKATQGVGYGYRKLGKKKKEVDWINENAMFLTKNKKLPKSKTTRSGTTYGHEKK